MKGIYVHNLNDESVAIIKSLNLSFIWTPSEASAYLTELKNSEITIYKAIGMFGADSDDEAEKYRAIDRKGNKIPTFAGWYRGLCPNQPEIIKKRFALAQKTAANDLYDGVWLDAIRYPTYWEANPPEYLDTCYCEICKKLYEEANNSGSTWEHFRRDQIIKTITHIKHALGNKTLGYFAVPDSIEQLQTIFAQAPSDFEKVVDFASPMIYSQMVGKDSNWALKIVREFQTVFAKNRVIPILQLVKMPDNSTDIFTVENAASLSYNLFALGNVGYFMLDQIINLSNNNDYFQIIKET